MSNPVKDARARLAGALGTATTYTAHSYVPARLIPPLVAIEAGSPYLEPGDTYGSFTLRLDAFLIVSAVNNETATDRLDDTITDAVVAAVTAGFGVETVAEPQQLQSGTATYLAVQISTTTSIAL